MSKVALIFPHFRTRAPTEMLFPPLGEASLAAQLRRLGIETRIFDGTFGTIKTIQQDLKAFQPEVVGIYSMVTLTRNTNRIADMVRASFPNSLIVAGGPLPTLYPAHYLDNFDAVFRGESDLSFPRFCRDLFEQKVTRRTLKELPLATYDGLFIQNHELSVDSPTVHYGESDLAFFPLPDRRDFDHAAYQKVWLRETGSKTTSIITTLGCPFDCDFCSKPVFGNVFRRRSLDAILEEVDEIRRLGYDSLWIADDTFTLNHRHLEEFCQRIAGLKIPWSCLSRADGISREVAQAMKEAGCRRVYLGLESGSQATLALMNKRLTVEDGANAVHLYRQAGIEVAAFFIVGYPGETVSSIEETFRHALTLPLDDISFNVPFPLPGSRLFERVSGLDEKKDWNEENEVSFVFRSEFDEDWLRRRIAQTLRAFAEKR